MFAVLGEDTITTAIVEDADLHDHLAKGLYEAKLAGAISVQQAEYRREAFLLLCSCQ